MESSFSEIQLLLGPNYAGLSSLQCITLVSISLTFSWEVVYQLLLLNKSSIAAAPSGGVGCVGGQGW